MSKSTKVGAQAIREANITLLEEHQTPEGAPEVLYCRLGDDIEVLYSELRNICLRQLESRDLDLLIVAAAVAFADRHIKRYVHTWSRKLCLTIPVHELELWSSFAVNTSLSNTLGYLTGDIWSFSFVKRQQPDSHVGQLFLQNLTQGDHILFPYSGGLDSFAASRLLKRKASQQHFYITIETSSQSRSVARKTIPQTQQMHAVIPIKFKKNDHPEASSRTRTFMFFAVTALAARMIRASGILVAENGQGSIGPSLVPCGAEHPYVGTHPAFTRRFAQFIETLWPEHAIRFEHPHVWMTKAELLLALKESGLSSDWDKTISCPCNLKRNKGSSAPAHCGVCSNCFLRRMSAFNSGLAPIQGTEPYLWNNLSVNLLADAADGLPIHHGTTKNDQDIALGGVLSHTHLAQFADESNESAAFSQTVYELSRSLSLDEQAASDKLKRLLLQHRLEWRAFLTALPAQSWVRQYAGDV